MNRKSPYIAVFGEPAEEVPMRRLSLYPATLKEVALGCALVALGCALLALGCGEAAAPPPNAASTIWSSVTS